MSAAPPPVPGDGRPLPVPAQHAYPVRFEWGPTGGLEAARGVEVAVVVDVLSFTTTVSVAADRGIAVSPYPWHDDGAATFARERGAVLAERRRSGAGVTLSPSSVRAAHGVEHVVLPSPNGSTVAARLADAGCLVVAACLRNAPAVAAWVGGRSVVVVAAGERWPDGTLRPAVEDLWGAGAVLAALGSDLSPEAQVAAEAWRAVAGRERQALLDCTSGRELVGEGFAPDVVVAAETGRSAVVPVLDPDRAFRPA